MSNLEDDLKQLRQELGQLRGDIGRIAETLEHTVKDGGAEAVQLAKGAAGEIKTDASKAAQSVTKSIESQPLNSAILALGAGVVLGLMLRR